MMEVRMDDDELKRFAAENPLLIAIGRALAPMVNEKLAEIERDLQATRCTCVDGLNSDCPAHGGML